MKLFYFMLKVPLTFVLLLALSIPAAASLPENLTGKISGEYTPDKNVIEKLAQIAQKTDIILFHGAWCRDCQREVPKFMKILSEANNPNLNLIDYKVDRDKKVLEKFDTYHVRRVPTFIVVRNGKELGRIIETPQNSLEENLLVLLKNSSVCK